MYYYQLAANKDDTDAQYKLGVIYDRGQQCERDAKKSFFYYFSLQRKMIVKPYLILV